MWTVLAALTSGAVGFGLATALYRRRRGAVLGSVWFVDDQPLIDDPALDFLFSRYPAPHGEGTFLSNVTRAANSRGLRTESVGTVDVRLAANAARLPGQVGRLHRLVPVRLDERGPAENTGKKKALESFLQRHVTAGTLAYGGDFVAFPKPLPGGGYDDALRRGRDGFDW